MLLTLLIEVKRFRDQCPEVHVELNGTRIAEYIESSQKELCLDVNECDCVQIIMSGKNQFDTELIDGIIVSDKAVIIKELKLEGCSYQNIREVVSYIDSNNNKLSPDNYMHSNGILSIKVIDLLQTAPFINDIEDLTFEQMAMEVLGRPTTIIPTNFDLFLPKNKNS